MQGHISSKKLQCLHAKNPDHFRHLRDMCKDIGIPFYLKQLGGNIKINGVYGGRRLDLALHDDIPTFGRGEALTGLPEKLNAQNY